MLPSVGLVSVRVADNDAQRSRDAKEVETGVGVHGRRTVSQVLFSKEIPILFAKVAQVRFEVGGLKRRRKMTGVPLINHQSDVNLVEQGELSAESRTHRHVAGSPIAQSAEDKQEE